MNPSFKTILVILFLLILFGCSSSSIKIGSPGEAKLILTVGASDQDGKIAFFSSRGPSAQGNTKPEVIAPGRYIVAARAKGTDLGEDFEDLGEFYTSLSGTSMATPMVAGASALLIEAYKQAWGENPNPRLLKAALIAGAKTMSVEGFEYDALHQGAGMIDVNRSLQLIMKDEPFVAVLPRIWNVKKLSTYGKRDSHFGQPMYSIAMLPGDIAYQKFLLVLSHELADLTIVSENEWVQVEGKSSHTIGNIGGEEQPEFIASVSVPDDASSGSYEIELKVYSGRVLMATIPVRFNVAEPLGEIESGVSLDLVLTPKQTHYSFQIGPHATELLINLSSDDDCLGVYAYGPGNVFLEPVDGGHGVFVFKIPYPEPGDYTLSLSSVYWDRAEPTHICQETNAHLDIQVYAIEVVPLSINTELEPGSAASFDGAIKNKGSPLNEVFISSFCGDFSEKNYSFNLTAGRLPNIAIDLVMENKGYYDEMEFEIYNFTPYANVSVINTGNHPTVAVLINPEGELAAYGSNELSVAPITTQNFSFSVEILSPGMWRILVFNINYTDLFGRKYFGGEANPNVSIRLGIPCSVLGVTPNKFEGIDTGGKGIFRMNAIAPQAPLKGDVYLSIREETIKIPFSIVPKHKFSGVTSDFPAMPIWRYIWFQVPSNAINTTINIKKEEANPFDLFLTSEATAQPLRQVVLPEYFHSFEIGKGIVYNTTLYGVGYANEYIDNNDGLLEIEFESDFYYSPIFQETGGYIEYSGLNLYVGGISESGYYVFKLNDKLNNGTIFVVGMSQGSHFLYVDVDNDYNLSEENPIKVGGKFEVGGENYKFYRIWEYSPYGYIELIKLKLIDVGGLSDNKLWLVGFYGNYSFAAPQNDSGGYSEPLFIDSNKNFNLSDETPVRKGDILPINDFAPYSVEFRGISESFWNTWEVSFSPIKIPIQSYYFDLFKISINEKTWGMVLGYGESSCRRYWVYFDINQDYIFSDTEGPYCVGNWIELDGRRLYISKLGDSPVLKEYLKNISFTLNLEPGLWRLTHRSITPTKGNLTIRHATLPVGLEIVMPRNKFVNSSQIRYNYTVNNTMNSAVALTCLAKVFDSKLRVIYSRGLNISCSANRTCAGVGTTVSGIPDTLGEYNLLLECNYSDGSPRRLRAVKQFFITDSENTVISLNVNNPELRQRDYLSYNLSIQRDRGVQGAFVIYLKNGTKILKRSENTIQAPTSITGEMQMNYPVGEYTLEAEFSYKNGRDERFFVDSEIIKVNILDVDEDGVSDIIDTLIGKQGSVETQNIQNLRIRVGGSEDLAQQFSGLQRVEFLSNGTALVWFDMDFSVTQLDLTNVVLIRQPQGSSRGYLLVSGINLSGVYKTLYVDRVSGSDRLCIRDTEPVLSIQDFSARCNAPGETLISCPSASPRYNCSIAPGKYIVSGLSHSGILEYPRSSGSSGVGGGGGFTGYSTYMQPRCNVSWACSEWGVCINGISTRTCTESCSGNRTTETRTCQESCLNGIMDGQESDVDCGGICRPCPAGKRCRTDMDCLTTCNPETRVCNPFPACEQTQGTPQIPCPSSHEVGKQSFINIPDILSNPMVWFGAIMVAVLFLVFVVVAGKRQSVKTPDASREILTGMKFPADPRLVDYLRLGIESGRPIAPMLRELYKLGWSEIELNEAMGRAMASAKPHTSQKPKAMKEPQSEKPAAK